MLLKMGENHHPKCVDLIGIINEPLFLHLVSCLYYLYQWCTVKQLSIIFLFIYSGSDDPVSFDAVIVSPNRIIVIKICLKILMNFKTCCLFNFVVIVTQNRRNEATWDLISAVPTWPCESTARGRNVFTCLLQSNKEVKEKREKGTSGPFPRKPSRQGFGVVLSSTST